MNACTYNLPAVYSAFPVSFASKDEYLAFVAAWKHAYRCLSLDIRIRRIESRQHDGNNPVKAVHLAKGIAAAKAARAALGECPYVSKGHGKYGFALGSDEATWLLQLRAESKLVAGRQRAAALAARAGTQ